MGPRATHPETHRTPEFWHRIVGAGGILLPPDALGCHAACGTPFLFSTMVTAVSASVVPNCSLVTTE